MKQPTLLCMRKQQKQAVSSQPLLLLLLGIWVMSLSSSSLVFVNAYKTGAGSCIGGRAAVGGYHLDTNGGQRQVLTGNNLSEAQVVLEIDGETLPPSQDNTAFSEPKKVLQTQTDYTIKLRTAQEPGFAGVLLRLEVPGAEAGTVDTTTALLPVNGALRNADDVCEFPIVGVTHASNDPKKEISAIIRLNQAATNVRLDVTMVGINDYRGSLYGYNGWHLEFQGESLPVGIIPSASQAPKTSPPTIDAKLINDIIGSPAPSHSSATRLAASTTVVIGLVTTAIMSTLLLLQ